MGEGGGKQGWEGGEVEEGTGGRSVKEQRKREEGRREGGRGGADGGVWEKEMWRSCRGTLFLLMAGNASSNARVKGRVGG